MKKIALAATLSAFAGSAFAGGMAPAPAPMEEPMMMEEDSSSSSNAVIPLLLLAVVAAVAIGADD